MNKFCSLKSDACGFSESKIPGHNLEKRCRYIGICEHQLPKINNIVSKDETDLIKFLMGENGVTIKEITELICVLKYGKYVNDTNNTSN